MGISSVRNQNKYLSIRWKYDKQVVVVHKHCYIAGQYVIEPVHYLKLLERKPGSIDNARPFKAQPWGEDFDFMRKELEYRYQDDGTKRYIKILMLFTKYSEDQLKAAVSICVKRRAFSEKMQCLTLSIISRSPSVAKWIYQTGLNLSTRAMAFLTQVSTTNSGAVRRRWYE